MLCPQCSAPMIRKFHQGRIAPYHTLNCSHCKFVIFYRGIGGEDQPLPPPANVKAALV